MSSLRPSSFLGLEYNQCTDEELQTFVFSRAPRRVRFLRTRERCLTLLVELDASATFRLFDLPRELQLNIYEDMLLYEPTFPEKLLTPSILATCQEINSDARCLLYTFLETTTLIRITCYQGYQGYHELSYGIRVPAYRIGLRFGSEPEVIMGYDAHLQEQLACWPPAISRNVVLSLKILGNIPLSKSASNIGTRTRLGLNTLSHSTFILATLLSGPGAKQVDFRLRGNALCLNNDELLSILKPLADLGPQVIMVSRGVPAAVTQQYESRVAASTDDSTALATWYQAFADATLMVETIVESGLPEQGIRMMRVRMNVLLREAKKPTTEHVDSRGQFLSHLPAANDEVKMMMGRPVWKQLLDEAKDILDSGERAKLLSELPFSK